MLLVAVATLSGTPIARFMSGTLTIPPPTPSRADTTPAHTAPTAPEPGRPTRRPARARRTPSGPRVWRGRDGPPPSVLAGRGVGAPAPPPMGWKGAAAGAGGD